MIYKVWHKKYGMPVRQEPVAVDDAGRKAAVLIPLVTMEDGQTGILYEVRSRKIIQGGEISFPGGGIEVGEGAMETAVRETCEELLLDASQVHAIMPLNEAKGPAGRTVTSVLGTIEGYEGTFSSDEVERIFVLPVSWFLSHSPVVSHAKAVPDLPDDFPFELIPGGRNYDFQSAVKDYYFYTTPEGVIWGLTAKLTWYFLQDFGKFL
ncbi:MAG: CoA pyrophosphatase [Lachnospiraceae bacterium]|nr:CoA pyrophosphatase [Lachnospiraceae bacterium]